MFKPAICEDEHGQPWVAYESDAAWAYVHQLSHRLTYIVLPRSAYLEGVLGASPSMPSSLSTVDISDPRMAEYLQRRVRLADCWQWLTNEATLGNNN